MENNYKAGDIISKSNGKWECKYKCVFYYKHISKFQRVQSSKSKADANRFPEFFEIKFFGHPVVQDEDGQLRQQPKKVSLFNKPKYIEDAE